MPIDKQTAVKWQINAAIRNIFAGECAVANHVIVVSAREIMHEYAKVKNIQLVMDIANIVKPAFVSKAKAMFKEHYNFLKHSDKDADEELDITNIHVFNEAETMMNIGHYAQLFNATTYHMRSFHLYMMMRNDAQAKLFQIG